MPFNDPVQKRDTAHDASVEIWVPIVVVVLAVVGLIILGVRRGWRINLANFSAGAAVATGTAVPTGAGGARELTAEQLAGGTTAGTTAPTTQTGTAGRAARRTRRARRTPSQISTTSLPAYQKEPGDEELVVYRQAAFFNALTTLF
ncbi:hypothetical protein PLICRDRAFT_173526 [Plicaturopsis crispa FD-325 SS-3]|nr:hypothetical protein PLICRDRAFT_173526 [Plicaturopsis crispa FD-325 SS-3]